MKRNMLKVILPVLLAALIFGLCACGGDKEDPKAGTASGQTAPALQEPAAEEGIQMKGKNTSGGCVLVIRNAQGEPVSGVKVTICDDDHCVPCTSGADGGVLFSGKPGKYRVTVLSAPAPYTFDRTAEYDVEIPGDTVTLTLEQPAGQ